MADAVVPQGTKEIKEVIIALGAVLPPLVKVLKDGVQATDAVALYNELVGNAEVKAAILAAADGIKLIPAEVKDLDAAEIAEIAVLGVQQTLSVVKALKA